MGVTGAPRTQVNRRAAIAGLRARAGPCMYVPTIRPAHTPSVCPSLPTPVVTRGSGRRPGPGGVRPPWFSEPVVVGTARAGAGGPAGSATARGRPGAGFDPSG